MLQPLSIVVTIFIVIKCNNYSFGRLAVIFSLPMSYRKGVLAVSAGRARNVYDPGRVKIEKREGVLRRRLRLSVWNGLERRCLYRKRKVSV